MVKKLVFIGCGPTTLGATYRINELIKSGELNEDDIQVIVLERESVAGGLAASVVDEKGFAWDMGVHIHAHPSKYECFTRCMNETVSEWNTITRNVKADMAHIFRDTKNGTKVTPKECQEHYMPYPVQLAVPLFPPAIRDECLADIRKVQEQPYPRQPQNFAEWTNRIFGQKLEDIFMRPYNKKVWTVTLEEMNAHWVGERVATIDVEKLEAISAKKKEDVTKEDLGWGPNQLFRYPTKLSGTGFIWQLVADNQPPKWFKFQHEAVKFDLATKKVFARDRKSGDEVGFEFDNVLSTMPIDILGKITGACHDLQLEYSKVALVGLGLKKPQAEFYGTMNWAYYPAEDLVFYRCTFLSNFNDVMTPDHEKYWSVVVEIGMRPDAEVNESDLVEKTIEGLTSRGVITGADQVVDRWTQILPYGYPIPTVNRDVELRKAHLAFQHHGIFSRGRFGGWKYEVANQDHSFAQGYEWVDHILKWRKETVYNAYA